MTALWFLLGAGALAYLWMMRGSDPTGGWFAAAVAPAETEEIAKIRISAIDAVVAEAGKTGKPLLAAFPIRRKSDPAKATGIDAYGIVQKIYMGKAPSGKEGRLYDIKVTSFAGNADDLPAVGTMFTIDNDSIATIGPYEP